MPVIFDSSDGEPAIFLFAKFGPEKNSFWKKLEAKLELSLICNFLHCLLF